MRVVAEHLKHGGVENGSAIGLHNDKARRAILIAIELGFIDKVPQLISHRNIRAPNLYGLTWLPTKDGSPPTNRWTRHATRADALAAVSHANAMAAVRRKDRAARRRRWKAVEAD
jgi:hypothetical protein